MPMLDRLPSVEEMIEALSSPVVPDGEAPVRPDITEKQEAQLSTDEMLQSIMMMLSSLVSQTGPATGEE